MGRGLYLSSRLMKPAGSSPVHPEFDFWGEASKRLREESRDTLRMGLPFEGGDGTKRLCC